MFIKCKFMKIAFPLSTETELAIDFAHSHFIAIFDENESVTQLIPVSGIEKNSGTGILFNILSSEGIVYVVSPYFSYMALRVFKENNIETLKANGTNLNQNIQYFADKELKPFEVYDTLYTSGCAKSCNSCDSDCGPN